MRVNILCSGVALGVYVPGLDLARDLRRRGHDAQIWLFEDLMPEEKREALGEAKITFHRDFRMAIAGHRLARGSASKSPKQSEITFALAPSSSLR